MDSLRLASFGVRGFVGVSLTPRVILNFAAAFGTYLDGGRVLLGSDTRYSSPMIHDAALSSLLAAGCEVLNFGICPTPVLQHCVRVYQADGALSISGGHRNAGWNTLTLIDRQGALLEPVGGEHVLELFHAGDFKRCDWKNIGTVQPTTDFFKTYLNALESHIDAEAIRKAQFTVLIDPVGGAGCPFLEPFAQRLNLKLIPINATPAGYLAREPEPRPRSALQMAGIIGYVNGDIGFLHSSDLARTSLVTETGEPASEEYTFAIIAQHLLSRGKTDPKTTSQHPRALVTNACTTRTIDDIATRHNVPLIKGRGSQVHIVAHLMDEQGALGGEGSGSVVLPAFTPAYDGFLAMALVLEAMAHSGQPLSALLDALPRYHIVKRDRRCDSRAAYSAQERLKEGFGADPDARVSLSDGIRIDWDDGWVHARPSHTQQTMRIISEAVTQPTALARAEQAIRIVEHRS